MVNRHILGVHAITFAVLRGSILLGTVQKALCRHAALVQTGASQCAFLNNRCGKARLRRTFGAQIPARAAANDQYVKLFHMASSVIHIMSIV